MAARGRGHSVAAMSTTAPLTTAPARDPLAAAVAGLLAADALGAIVSLATGLDGPGHLLGSGSPLCAPPPLIAVQLLAALAALAAGRRAALAGGVVLALACSLSLAAAASDGDLGRAGLSPAEVGVQVLIVAATAVTLLLVLARIRCLRVRSGS